MTDWDLGCFIAASELLNFTRAAERCNTSLSALSRAIRRLEDELGTELFVRNTRTTSLSSEGARFIPRARAILQEWELARAEYEQKDGELFGTLSIFATVTAAYSLLPPLLNPFRIKQPGVEVHLRTGDAAYASDQVLAGETDLAIVPIPALPRPRLSSLFLARTELRFVSAADKPFGLDWRNTPVILPEAGLWREMIDEWFAKRFIKPKVYAQVSGNEGVLAMVRLGFGIGLVPELVVQNSPFAEGLRFLPALEGLEEFPIGLAYLETRKKLPIIRAFLDIAEARTSSQNAGIGPV